MHYDTIKDGQKKNLFFYSLTLHANNSGPWDISAYHQSNSLKTIANGVYSETSGRILVSAEDLLYFYLIKSYVISWY